MYSVSPARWLVLIPVWAACAVSAQTVPAPAAPAPAAHTTPVPLSFHSALEAYQPFTDAKPIPWREANDTVGRIGGWQAYAREAQQAPSPPDAAQPVPHSGHAKP